MMEFCTFLTTFSFIPFLFYAEDLSFQSRTFFRETASGFWRHTAMFHLNGETRHELLHVGGK